MNITLNAEYLKHNLINQNRKLSKLEAWILLIIIADEKGKIKMTVRDLSKQFMWTYDQTRYFILKKTLDNKLIIGNSQTFTDLTIIDIANYKDLSQTIPKPNKNKFDYIDQIISIFQEVYFRQFKTEYSLLNKGQDRKAMGKILGHYKKIFPTSDSEHTLIGLRNYFEMVCSINDDWISNNLTPSIIVSKFNVINKYIQNGRYKKSGQQQSDEIGAIVDAVWDTTKRKEQ